LLRTPNRSLQEAVPSSPFEKTLNVVGVFGDVVKGEELMAERLVSTLGGFVGKTCIIIYKEGRWWCPKRGGVQARSSRRRITDKRDVNRAGEGKKLKRREKKERGGEALNESKKSRRLWEERDFCISNINNPSPKKKSSPKPPIFIKRVEGCLENRGGNRGLCRLEKKKKGTLCLLLSRP